MKIRNLSLLAVVLLEMSGVACRHHHAEGPVEKTKDVFKDLGHDVKEAAHDIKHDIKK